MGSGRVISLSGPSVVFVYMIIGFFLFFVMRAMGELLLSNLRYKSFADFAADLVGPWAGFFVGWSYWFTWVVTAVAELVAITAYAQFWWPNLPLWVPTVVVVAIIFLLNVASVKNFGEMEFWFALIKVAAILILIAVGIVLVATGFTSPSGNVAQISNLWDHGGMFPHGPMGVVAGFQVAVFAFSGIELIGTTAAEARDPKVTLPRAINSVPWRILIFYVGALLAILTVTPWDQMDPAKSPFVGMFSLIGFAGAASLVNFVVLTSATSSANAGVFSTSRMMFGLASEGNAPGFFRKLSDAGIPTRALALTALLLLMTIPVLYAGDTIIEAFTVITTVSALLFMTVWTMIIVSYIAYRRKFPERHERSTFKMPGGVVSCYAVLAFFLFVVWTLTTEPETVTGLLAMPVWLVVIAIAWFIVRRTDMHKQAYVVFKEEMSKPVSEDSLEH